jgi:hypothetical protein
MVTKMFGEKTDSRSMAAVDRVNNRLLKMVEKHVGNKVTSNQELDIVGKKLFHNKFMGTYPADMLPRLSNVRPYCILNLDVSGQPGSHWIACVYEAGGILVYDSFGRSTRNILPGRFKGFKTYDSEKNPEQKVSEDNCGARALTAILMYDSYGADVFLRI